MENNLHQFIKKIFFSLFVIFLFFVKIDFSFAQDFYWENPELISRGDSRFPKTISSSDSSAIFWQEIDLKNHQIYLSALITEKKDYSIEKDVKWIKKERFAGPFFYSGEVPDLYSVAINESGRICVSVLSESNKVSVFTLPENENDFIRIDFESQELPVVAPRIYSLRSGGFILFTSLGKDESFSLLTAKSQDGIRWSNFRVFDATKNFTNPFLPVLISTPKGDLLFFQAQFNSGTRLSYQLFSTVSKNNGTSWSSPNLVTGPESLLQNSTDVYTSFHNQRPSLLEKDGKIYVAWERTYYASENSQIYFSEIDFDSGKIVGHVEQITSGANAIYPILFLYNNLISLTWFDTRNGIEASYFSQKNGYVWTEQRLSNIAQQSIFSSPLTLNSLDKIAFVWQTNNSIYRLKTDTSVNAPQIVPLTYAAGKRSTLEKVRYQIVLPNDSSGIAGYSWIWTKDKNEIPPESLMALPKDRFVSTQADDEGEYFFIVRALDYAGNWSVPKTVSYFRDLTAPPKPVINLPKKDDFGFSFSNTFNISWNLENENFENINLKDKNSLTENSKIDRTNVDDVAGYSYKFVKVENLSKEFLTSKKHPLKIDEIKIAAKIQSLNEKYNEERLSKLISAPQKKVMQRKSDAQFINYSNGIYIFSVRAIDQVGNASEPSYAVLYLNKYEPFTFIQTIKKSTDIFGESTISLEGNGFTYDGIVSEILITKENSNVPKIRLNYANGDYKIDSNNKISGIKIPAELERGNYFITLNHSDRGLYKSKNAFSILTNGTVKIENYYEYVPSWYGYTKLGKYNIQVSYILFIFLMIFTIVGFVFALRGIVITVKDFNLVNLEIQAVIKGDIMPSQKTKVVSKLKKKGGGLKLKLIIFTVFLVLMVSLLVSLPLGFIMIKTQEQSLSKGLNDRVNVLLESLTSGTKAYMPTENVLELSYLPSQSSALAEANFITIAGFKSNENDFENGKLDYVWASNDERIIGNKDLIINTSTYQAGNSYITDNNFLSISENLKLINDSAKNIIGEISYNIANLNAEGASLAIRNDSISVARRNEIADITTDLTNKMTESLNKLSIENSSSYPQFNVGTFDRENTEYLFYRPVLYRSGSSQNYVRAVVYISVSTKTLIAQLESERQAIIYMAFIVSVIAIAIGTVCAFILASIIVNPIRRLTKHVQMIGETADKEKLAGKEIAIKSKDEIGQLGDMVNEMTRGLVKAAQDEHLLMDGKVVQQTFLPLGTDSRGNKQTFAELKDKSIEFFGYYEGASGVSGDYFDYKKLDERWYVIIKCDVSGHGVPAALLMTVVATLFRKYFENWSFKNKGTDLTTLVCTINDFIEGLGLKGKFATIILSLVDTKTGDVYLCNAGDNLVHIYDSTKQKQTLLTLQEAPAAGPMPTFMVEMKGGFKLEKTHLNQGDVLFLYTDGIEESTRHFRDANSNIIECNEVGLKVGDEHKNHKVGQTTEQLEPERVNAIIEAALNKKTYVLERYHSANPSEKLEFDFSKCEGSLKDAILALASVEKVFRFYKDSEVTKNDVVRVDKEIDLFLKKCFNRYDYYCTNQQEISAESSYLYYTALREDEQLDDLTLLAVKRS